MTSNQLAFASNVETQRHNAVTEAETERHNREMESTNNQLADVERRKADALERYQTNELRLKEEYNRWYSEYQTASTDRKLDIEEKLQQIAWERAQNDKNYQDAQTFLKSEENSLKQSALEETKRSNQAQEALTAYDKLLKERQIEYQNTFWRETITNAQAENAINMLRFGLEQEKQPYVLYDLFTKSEKQHAESYPFIKPLPLSTQFDAGGNKHFDSPREFFQRMGFMK